MPDKREPNPDWVAPNDGDVVSVIMTHEGTFQGIYDAKTETIKWFPVTFTDAYGICENN